ncbi:MAG: DUF294 nucleotidyltransferase-like domain-containing protein [Candidatus Berkiella sp.]
MTQAKNSGWLQSISNALYNAYTGIVNFVKNPFDNLTSYFKGNINPDKQALDNLRNQHFSDISTESNKTSPNYVQLAKNITQDTKQYINNLIDQEIKKLGKPPCDFSVITLGSMARKESGPVTDLEIGFLIKDKSVKNYQYFYQLSQNLSDRLFLLGEHPDIGGKGLRMDEADNAPPHLRFFARNATKEQAQQLLNEAVMNREWDKIPYEGSRPFLATAEEFASYSQPQFTQDKNQLAQTRRKQYEIELAKALKDPKNAKKAKTAQGRKQIENEVHFWVNQMYRPFSPRELRTANDAGKKLGRNMDLLYGNQALYNRFITKREGYFAKKEANGKSLRQNIAKDKMADDVREVIAKGKSPYVTGKLGKTLDIKRELYRFVEQFVTNLGFYHHCKNQNTFDIVNELKDKKILSPQLASKMSDFIQFTSGLRLKEQRILKRQGYAAYFDQAQFNEDKEDLEKEIKQLKDSIGYAEQAKQDTQIIAAKKRDLIKLENDYQHLLEMAPGKILSQRDIQTLQQKYIPLGQEIFKAAVDWTQHKEKLGFTPVPTQFTPAMKNALDYVQHHPKGFFPALAQLKQQQKDLTKTQLHAFVSECQKEHLLTTEDYAKINELKVRRAAAAA